MVANKSKSSRSQTGMQKKCKDVNAPKKPMSGYLIFGQEQRNKNEDLRKMPVAEQGKIISEMWKNLSEEQRNNYNDISNKEREHYYVAMDEYKKSDQYQEYLEKVKETDSGKKKKKGTKKVTGYNEFFKEIRKTISEENPGFSMTDTTSAVAKRWKELSTEEKEVYKKIADEKNMKVGIVEE
ncbi:HMG domain-containing chromatin-associated [Ordospora colligata]|uniref:HMG domain-containing chromatin-associated n=1 Tax=Ordospora colligata OC4 TaxID=1354746 RepID=A0A0B2UJN7_9MICR|nr:HMG domain-containing chromatin-associated [Ordospora colligata OC4]KHN69464.1 HMG domain-containing chromatin-associated [Ordospora colligata OC4]TBU15208.1 HMG domain-containing chromatin-associated [Ordospora colligata]TBU15279.1 HMG domain-containing chromatin-associated [Ordospora colligata]TBU18461.1 HMG domain-containing chromatin-associated [Ordospora colligata]